MAPAVNLSRDQPDQSSPRIKYQPNVSIHISNSKNFTVEGREFVESESSYSAITTVNCSFIISDCYFANNTAVINGSTLCPIGAAGKIQFTIYYLLIILHQEVVHCFCSQEKHTLSSQLNIVWFSVQ